MRDFRNGVKLGVNEDDYQAALQEYPDGLVISLNRNQDGEYSLHIATCGTLSFDLAAKNQDSRAGKLFFRDQLNSTLGLRPITMSNANG